MSLFPKANSENAKVIPKFHVEELSVMLRKKVGYRIRHSVNSWSGNYSLINLVRFSIKKKKKTIWIICFFAFSILLKVLIVCGSVGGGSACTAALVEMKSHTLSKSLIQTQPSVSQYFIFSFLVPPTPERDHTTGSSIGSEKCTIILEEFISC